MVFHVVVNSLKSNSNRTIWGIIYVNITNSAGFVMCQVLKLIVKGFGKTLIHEEQQ